ncbi:hypothetical protein [Vulcanisaeta distributa]|nr:hypothetical protein [Vulcanisaeta distributa]
MSVKVGRIKYGSFAYVGRIRVRLDGREAEDKDKGKEQGGGGGGATQ